MDVALRRGMTDISQFSHSFAWAAKIRRCDCRGFLSHRSLSHQSICSFFRKVCLILAPIPPFALPLLYRLPVLRFIVSGPFVLSLTQFFLFLFLAQFVSQKINHHGSRASN